MCYTVDVYSCVSSLPVENTPVMESNVDKILVDRTATESSVPTLAGEAVTTPTNMDSDVPVNSAAVKLSLSNSCEGNISEPAVVPDVDLGMILLLYPLLCLLLHVML